MTINSRVLYLAICVCLLTGVVYLLARGGDPSIDTDAALLATIRRGDLSEIQDHLARGGSPQTSI
jgi:hypothetical protein